MTFALSDRPGGALHSPRLGDDWPVSAIHYAAQHWPRRPRPHQENPPPMATDAGPEEHPGAHRLTWAEFVELFKQLRDATARGPEDRRGTLNNLTPAHVLAAIGEVRSGQSVSLAAPIETIASRDNPEPCNHEMDGVG